VDELGVCAFVICLFLVCPPGVTLEGSDPQAVPDFQ
jgi:hypothetical protein